MNGIHAHTYKPQTSYTPFTLPPLSSTFQTSKQLPNLAPFIFHTALLLVYRVVMT